MEIVPDSLKEIYEKVVGQQRLSFEDGVCLFASNDIHALGYMANIVRERKNGNKAFYIINQHLNYTNACKNRCKFCAFSSDENDPDAYLMTPEQALEEVKSTIPPQAKEIHIVGGLHPRMKIDYYEELLGVMRDTFPSVHLQAFTAVEIAHIAEISELSVEDTLVRLRDAGLGSLPGGGAEVFDPGVRNAICPEKITGEQWLDVMRIAHGLGIRSNATLLYGHVESPEHCVDHLITLRELQDETGGFLTFIPLLFHPLNTDIELEDKQRHLVSGLADLKQVVVGRLMLDNFDHIKSFWIMMGIKLSQVSLSFGADDMDGTVVEEKITHSAGAQTPKGITVGQMKHLIAETGRVPIERDTLYNEFT